MLKTYLIFGVVILALLRWGSLERSGKISIQAEYDTFIAKTEAIKAKQEKDNAEAIHAALTKRDAAIRLRNEARANLMRVSLAAEGVSQGCFRSQEFDAAISTITGIVEQGETALINFKSCMESWPR